MVGGWAIKDGGWLAIEQGKWVGAAHGKKKKKGRKGSHNLAINRGVLLLIVCIPNPKDGIQVLVRNWERNVLRHIVILKEHLIS